MRAFGVCWLLFAACESSDTFNTPQVAPWPPARAAQAVQAPDAHDVRVDALPRLKTGWEARYDAGPSDALRASFGAQVVRPCGVLDADATATAVGAARTCVRDALAGAHSFALVERLQGTDSDVVGAMIGTVDDGQFTVYEMSYDSDPCGGMCEYRGGTRLVRCTTPPSELHSRACELGVVNCYPCPDAPVIESWHHGVATTAPLTEAERILPRLLGSTPASLGPLFDGLRPGSIASAIATDTRLVRADAEAKASGIVYIHADGGAAQLLAVRVGVAGRCGAFRDRLVAAWGASPDDAWIAAERRAYLTRDDCVLHVEQHVDIADWIADKPNSIVPIRLIGASAATARATLAPSHDIHAAQEQIEWSDTNFARRGGPVKLYANIEHSRIVAIVVEGQSDLASIDSLRNQLVTLYGAPDDAHTKRRTADAELEVGKDGSFCLSVSQLLPGAP